MLRPFLLIALLLADPAAVRPEEEPPYKVPEPAGWAKETSPLPPAFAQGVTWMGEEAIRFAPDWMKADSDTFFSYAMLFWLADDPKIDAATLERELLTYYRGLARAVFGSRKRDVDVGTFTLTVKRAADRPGNRPGGEPVEAYVGELKWTEPFATGKPQTLRLEVHTWSAEKHKRRCIFIAASPQPETAAVWKTLREIRAGCTVR